MSASAFVAPGAGSPFRSGGSRSFAAIGQYILNLVGAAARRAADRRRFSGLPRRYLDDVDMTPAELEAALAQLDSLDARQAPGALVHSV
jgi:hypothetical protein